MSDITQVERQIHILSLLSENKKGFTVNEIHHSLSKLGIDVSKKTVERDLDDISGHFFVFEEEQKDGEVRYMADKLNIDNITFSVSELISLYFLKQIVKPYKALDVGNTAGAMIDRLLEKAPTLNQAYIDRIEDLIKVNPLEGITEKYIDNEWIKTIREAIEKNHRLKIEYFSFNSGEITRRRVDPYFLEIREGCYHLVGFCHLRREVRDFRVSRIKKLEIIEETYKRPENFYENYNQTRFDKLAGDEPIELKIVFDGLAAKYVREYENQKADTISDLGDGKIFFEKKTTYSSDILQWVLRFGADAEVLEPEALRFEVTWEAERMVQKYKNRVSQNDNFNSSL